MADLAGWVVPLDTDGIRPPDITDWEWVLIHICDVASREGRPPVGRLVTQGVPDPYGGPQGLLLWRLTLPPRRERRRYLDRRTPRDLRREGRCRAIAGAVLLAAALAAGWLAPGARSPERVEHHTFLPAPPGRQP